MKNRTTKKPDNQKTGTGLIFAVILLFVILAMVVTLSSVTVLETKLSQKTKSSVGAFYTSESGIEWALNQISSSSGPKISDAFQGYGGGVYPCPGSFNCTIYFLDKDGNVITSNLDLEQVKAVRSVGTQDIGSSADTQRAIEAAVAAGGEGITGGCSEDTSKILMTWGNGCKPANTAIDGNKFCADANDSGHICGPSGWVPSNQTFCVCVKN